MIETLIFVAGKEDVDTRLDVFLASNLDGFTRSRVKGCVEMGMVRVRGERAEKSGVPLKENDIVEIDVEDAETLSVEPEDIPLNIVYQDNDLIIINKKQGMVVHPASGSPNGTLVNALLYHVKDLSGINGVLRPGIVHRLDKDTSGLIMVAKNDVAHASLSQQIAEKSAKRFYLAIVDGNIKEDTGIIEQPIGRSKNDRKKMWVSAQGKPAKTKFTVLERFGKYTFVEYELFTGRTHQIRVHSAFTHHPVVGDKTYGGSDKFNLNGQLLHAYRLVLKHPVTDEDMEFTAPIPDYFAEVLDYLRKTLAK